LAFYTEDELKELGIKKFGKNVKISTKTSIYGADRMSFGDNIRVDDFCILTGDITIGSYVHIAAFSFLSAWEESIILDGFVNISSRVNIFTGSDDYSGKTMSSPLIPDDYKNVDTGAVLIKRHSIVGVNSVIMPGVILEEGTATGAMSFVTSSTNSWTIYAGVPAKPLKKRKKDLLELEKKFLKDYMLSPDDE